MTSAVSTKLAAETTCPDQFICGASLFQAFAAVPGATAVLVDEFNAGGELRPCRFDPLVADVSPEVALDDLGTDDDHLLQYGTDFQKLEDGRSLRATQTSPGNGRDGLFIAVSLSEFTIAHAV
jgi:hypothetical protein